MDAEISAAFGLTASQIAPEPTSTLTVETLRAQMHELQMVRATEPLRVIFTATALELTSERLFAYSKHRSARIRKKLIKRFGGEYRYAPALWQIGNVIYAHPIFEARFRAVAKERTA